MFRRDMCTGKRGIDARREGLNARRDDQRSQHLQNRRNISSSEKKVVIPKPKESVSERRARLEQYREMKTTRESKLRAERLKTPAFKVGPAPTRERVTPSTARKMLDFGFKKTSGGESSSASEPKTSRKALLFGGDSTTSKKSNPGTRTPHSIESLPKIAVRRNLQRDLTSSDGVSQRTKTPQPASKTPSREQSNATPSANAIRERTTPKIAMTPSRTLTSRFTPSKTATSSALKGAPNSSKSTRTPLIAAGSRQGVKATPKEVGSRPTPSKPHITPSQSGSAKSNFARTKPSAKKATPNAVGIRATPSKSASTPLKSAGPKNDVAMVKTTPKPTPLANSTRLNRLKQATASNTAQASDKKLNTTPRKLPSSTLKRAQSSCNLSRPCPPQSVKNPGRVVGNRNPPTSTALKRAQSTNNLSRPSPSSKVTNSRPTASQNGTPQGKMLRSTSASTLTRKALSSASPEIKPRLNLSKKFIGDSRNEKEPAKQGSDFTVRKPITRSNSALTSATKPSTMSRIKAAVLRKQQAKVEVQKQKVVKSDEENNKKWADLMALIQAQKAS